MSPYQYWQVTLGSLWRNLIHRGYEPHATHDGRELFLPCKRPYQFLIPFQTERT